MARINIEDQFWDEVALVKLDRYTAIGQAIALFKLAQYRYKQGKIISDDDWRIHEFSDALIPVFAKKVEGGYEVNGADKHFGWLLERKEAARNGGLARGGGKAQAAAERERRKSANRLMLGAVARGEMIRPDLCENCGESGKIQGHHTDYSKPFEVDWLCTKCHGKEHTFEKNQGLTKSTSKTGKPQASPSFSPSKEKINNSFNTKTDYGDAAQRVLQAVKMFGPDSLKSFERFVGPEVWSMVQAAGGVRHFRTMKDDQWLLTNVTKILAATKTTTQPQRSS